MGIFSKKPKYALSDICAKKQAINQLTDKILYELCVKERS